MSAHGDRRDLTLSLSLSGLDLGAAFGPSDCWIRSNFFLCRETTYYWETPSVGWDIGSRRKRYEPPQHSRLLYTEQQWQAVSAQYGVPYQELVPQPLGSIAAPWDEPDRLRSGQCYWSLATSLQWLNWWKKTHPTPALPTVARKTVHLGSLRKLEIALCLCGVDILPSKRSKRILLAFSAWLMRSSILVQ